MSSQILRSLATRTGGSIQYCLSAGPLQARLVRQICPYFTDENLSVSFDDNITTLDQIHVIYVIQPSVLACRPASFRSSEPIAAVPLDQQPRVHIDRDAAQWQHVANILASPLVPQPTVKSVYTSGWQPPAADAVKLPYFVERTKNHMFPVYVNATYRGQRRITTLKRVSGDIWQLEHELHAAIERRLGGKAIVTRVNEMNGQILFKGDFVTIVQEFLASRGL